VNQTQPYRTSHRIPVWQMEPGWRFLHPMSPDVFTCATIEEIEFGCWVVWTREGFPVEFWAKEEAEVFVPGYLR
jgi:hypothetical protein